MFELQANDEVRFSFWTPVGKSAEASDDNRILRGVASTEAKDRQGEIVLQKGIDTEPLLREGKINWNHQAMRDPAAIIGRPLIATLNSDGELYVEGKLFKGLPAADDAWRLACYFDEHPDDGRLGWSIEGKGLRKGNVIAKTSLRHLALTHDPAQPASWASIVKAMLEGIPDVELTKALTTGNAAALLLENLDSNQRSALAHELFFGRVAKADAATIWNTDGTYKDGVLGAHRQLVAKGIPPDDAKEFLIKLKKAGLL